jgi:hypothetical protein
MESAAEDEIISRLGVQAQQEAISSQLILDFNFFLFGNAKIYDRSQNHRGQ